MDWLSNKIKELEAFEEYGVPELRPFSTNDTECGKLNLNENVFLPKAFVSSLAKQAAEEIDPRFYPTDEAKDLAITLSRHLGIPENTIVFGSGGDQLIDLVARTFLDRHSTAVTVVPTYSFYRLRSLLTGAQLIEVPLRYNFSLDVETTRDAAKDARILFLCSPNNPTGNQFSPDDVTFLLKKSQGIVVVDEAYVEYSGNSVVPLMNQYKNLIVLRTFSKAFGLAGMRLGYMVANPAITKPFAEKIQYPFAVNTFTLRLAKKFIEAFDVIKTSIEQMIGERDYLFKGLGAAGVRVFPSSTNFIFCELGEKASHVHRALDKENISIRHLGDLAGHRGCLRITVGQRSANEKLLTIMRNFVNP